ncbi:MAG TPA: DUF488 domain-containing protein [Terriglobia bacterium]|nr:DUF488 domain-containing protein [Terriglobia bacterium]
MGFKTDKPEPQKTANALFTVGHSSMEAGEFTRLLGMHKAGVVMDVRSRPASGRFPHFNGAVLENILQSEGIAYQFLGEELGGRPSDPAAYSPDGVVNYRACRRSYNFSAGIERIERELQTRPIVLMCAEEDPIECHRFLMICPELVALGLHPLHIRRDGNIETQEAAEDRLLRSTGLGHVAANTLFPAARAETIEEALELQARKYAFRVDPHLVHSGFSLTLVP